MQKLINSHKRQTKLAFTLISLSVLALVLLAISPVDASINDTPVNDLVPFPKNPVLENNLGVNVRPGEESAIPEKENVSQGEESAIPANTSLGHTIKVASLPEMNLFLGPAFSGIPEEAGSPETSLVPDENVEPENSGSRAKPPSRKTLPSLDIPFMLAGVGAAVLTFKAYPRISAGGSGVAVKDAGLVKTPLKLPFPLKNRTWTVPEEPGEVREKQNSGTEKPLLLIALPVLSIALAELLIFSGHLGVAVWLHIGTLIALSLSAMFIKTHDVDRVYQAMMLLPVLRLVNLSMPVFFDITLYSFIFVYGPLAIPVAVIALHQKPTLKQAGFTLRKFWTYLALSIPLGFLMGLGEYQTIHTGYLIPDLSLGNLLKLTLIMVLFVGLVEELIFRSILQTRLEQVLGVGGGIILTSLLFGLMHSGYGTPFEIIYTASVGVIISYIFHKTKSLPFITLLHGFVNVFLFGIFPHLGPGLGLF